jgi:hypothetical protein
MWSYSMSQRTTRIATKTVVLLSMFFLFGVFGAWSQNKSAITPETSQAVGFAVSPAVSDIPPEMIQQGMQTPSPEDEGMEGGIRNPHLPWSVVSDNTPTTSDGKIIGAPQADGALQSQAPSLNIPSPINTFDGVLQSDNASAGFGALTPPDPNGAVGPNHYVQQVNLLYKIFNKSGVLVAGPLKLSTLWASAGPPASTSQCAASDQGDPIVLYDAIADRWILSQFGFASSTAPPYYQCIAISKTGDPTGAYYLYSFQTGGTSGVNEFPDYPKLGVWTDGYYMMVHQFTNGGNFNGSGYYSFNRQKMLMGDPTANYIYFNLNLTTHPEGIGGSLPGSVDGLNLPAVGRPDTFAYFTATVWGDPANGLRLFEFHADFTTPANSTLTEPYTTYASPLPVAAFDVTTPTGNGGRRAVPQPGVTVTAALDAITDRLMHRLQYRNFGSYETLVTNHTVGAPASTTFGTFVAAPRYYELRRALPSGSWVVQEQATFAPGDGLSRWMGSAAEDNAGNLAIGYSRSGATAPNYVGLYYAGRLASDPSGGLFQGENTLFAGAGSQTSTANRWGDYSALSVDPVDDCTFWYTNEYYNSPNSSANWRTRIGSFKFSQCTAPPVGTLTGKITSCSSGAPIPGALMQVSDGHSGTAGPDGTYSVKLSPASYTAFAQAASFISGSNPASITDGNTTTLNACIAGGTPIITVSSKTVSGGDGSGTLKPNDCKQLSVTIANSGIAALTGATATLTSSTPGVNIAQPTSPYPSVNPSFTGTNTNLFSITTDSSLVCGVNANFTLKINSAQGVFNVPFSVSTCTSAPVSFSGSITTASPTQTGRIARNGVTSTCAAPKAFPGLQDSTVRHRQTFGPYSNSSTVSTCVTVNLTASGTCSTGLNLFGTTYMPSFTSTSIATNYLADPGSTFAGTATWSFLVPAGQSFFVNANEITANAGCSGFTGSITGLLDGSGGAGACSIGVVSGSVQLITTATLVKNGDGSYNATVVVTNNGTGTAQSVQITVATLGTAGGTSLPISLGNISPGGGSAVTTVNFPASAGVSGAAVIERYSGTYTGGTFVGSIRATLP